MNVEYESHKRVWEMLRPRVHAQLETGDRVVWARPIADAPLRGFDWLPADIDLELLAHGHMELASPLSEW